MKRFRYSRKYVSLFCAMMLLLDSSVVSGAATTPTTTFGAFTFKYSSESMTIGLYGYDSGKNESGEVVLPDKYENQTDKSIYYMVGIEPRVFQGKSLNSLVVETKKSEKDFNWVIGTEAFAQAEIGISFPNAKARFQNGVITAVNPKAFQGARIGCNLIFDTVEGGIGSYAFQNIEVQGNLVIHGSLTYLEKYALSGVKAQGMDITNDIQEICEGAFLNNSLLREFTLSDSLKILGPRAFEGCDRLERVTLPSSDGERTIAENAFPDREGLTIVIPKGLTDLQAFHLANYKNAVFQTDPDVTADSPVISYLRENGLTYKKGEEGAIITPGSEPPEATPTEKPTTVPTEKPTEKPSQSPVSSVISSPDSGGHEQVSEQKKRKKSPVYVFKNITYKIKNKNSVTVTGTAKKKQKKIKIPDTVMIKGRLYKVSEIQKKAFKKQKKLTTVFIGNYVSVVGDEAFASCSKLAKIQFGTGVKKLGKKVLYKDRKLRKIIFKGKKLKKIGRKTFYGVPFGVDIRAVRSKVKYYAKLIRRSRK